MSSLLIHAIAGNDGNILSIGFNALTFQCQAKRNSRACRFHAVISYLLPIAAGISLQPSPLVWHLPLGVSARFNRPFSQAPAIEIKRNMLAVRIGIYANRNVFHAFPVPMWKQMHHWPFQPMRLILIESILSIQEQINGAGLRAKPWPDRFAPMLNACPLKPTRKPFAC